MSNPTKNLLYAIPASFGVGVVLWYGYRYVFTGASVGGDRAGAMIALGTLLFFVSFVLFLNNND